MAQPVTFESRSDVGRTRQQNEDSRGELEASGGTLLIVCDGMGGHSAGDVASRIAVDAIGQIFKNSPADDPAERLKSGFLVANQRILAHAEKENIDSMGTTAVAAFVRDGKAWIAHVGDSRCYQLRDGAVVWKTADHTRVQKMIERGILTPEQAKTHEDANVVTRALGFKKGEEAPEPDVTVRELDDGDLLLLCSDGLYDLVKDDEIAELGSDPSLDSSTRELVDLANGRGGHDNITVTIARSGSAPARKAAKRTTDLDEPAAASAPSAGGGNAAIAKARAEAEAARESAERSKRALVLVVSGFALVGIAAAVFFLTRGEDTPVATRTDAGSGSAVAPVTDAGATAPGDTLPADSAVAPTLNFGSGGTTPTTPSGRNRKDAGVAGDAAAATAAADAGPTAPAVTPDAGAATSTPAGGFGSGAQPLGVKPDAGVVSPVKPDAGVVTKPDAGASPKPDASAKAGSGSAT